MIMMSCRVVAITFIWLRVSYSIIYMYIGLAFDERKKWIYIYVYGCVRVCVCIYVKGEKRVMRMH